ncbi:hypothetical protein EV44_g3060 [Erysiphe necator]|uniref:Uncharacterized protein n=1 Tax=Uncinula necator TaxID=52586 RepID=A0A0B1PAB7_UNCNE|nr:hypothetical protein EV44_g3060 [Erysiphe necator]
MVSEALQIAFSNERRDSIRPYVGSLYSNELGYLTWPIVQDGSSSKIKKFSPSAHWLKSTYQVVFAKNGDVIDLIVRLSNHDFAKCRRHDNYQLETQEEEIDPVKSYFCGARYIPKDDIERSIDYFHEFVEFVAEKKTYPASYRGRKYRKDLGLQVWPIYRGQNLYSNPKNTGGPYLILVDSFGQLKRVIARTYDYDFVDCIASSTEIPAHVTHSKGEGSTQSKGTTRSGFDCNGIFFDDKELHLARNLARESRRSRHNVFPVEHFSPPCDLPCLLWPLKPSGSTMRNGMMPCSLFLSTLDILVDIFTLGNLAPYRLVMSLDFQILFVALKGHEKMKKCERRTIAGGNINHDQSSFRCSTTVFHNSEVLAVVHKACKEKMLHSKKYPMSYEGENFQVPGPYLIYPLKKGKEYNGGCMLKILLNFTTNFGAPTEIGNRARIEFYGNELRLHTRRSFDDKKKENIAN